MAMTTLSGHIVSFVDGGHICGYSALSTIMIEGADGRRHEIRDVAMTRSDIATAILEAQQTGEPVEIYLERPFFARWLRRQIFGIKTPRSAHFDATNLALIGAGLVPGGVLAFGLFAGVFMGLFSTVSFLTAMFVAMVGAVIVIIPLWALMPLSIIGLIGVLLTRVDRRAAFYGADPQEAARIKEMEPSAI